MILFFTIVFFKDRWFHITKRAYEKRYYRSLKIVHFSKDRLPVVFPVLISLFWSRDRDFSTYLFWDRTDDLCFAQIVCKILFCDPLFWRSYERDRLSRSFILNLVPNVRSWFPIVYLKIVRNLYLCLRSSLP